MMTRIYMQPWRELDNVRTELNRMFNQIPQTSHQFWTPAIELQNTENAFILRVEVPGVEAKDLDVQVSRQTVQITGTSPQPTNSVRTEFRYGAFRRLVELPSSVAIDNVQANLKDGILTLTLTKLSSLRPAVVKVNVIDGETANTTSENQQNLLETDSETVPENHLVKEDKTPTTGSDSELTQDIW